MLATVFGSRTWDGGDPVTWPDLRRRSRANFARLGPWFWRADRTEVESVTVSDDLGAIVTYRGAHPWLEIVQPKPPSSRLRTRAHAGAVARRW